MQKDMKIGMFVGLVLAIGVMVYLSIQPDLSPRARILKQNGESIQAEDTLKLSVEPLSMSYDSNQTELTLPQQTQITQVNEIQPQESEDNEVEPAYTEENYETRKFYIVRKGDTLSKISRRYYGSPNKWYKIYEANRDVLDNPNMLKPGLKLYIPN